MAFFLQLLALPLSLLPKTVVLPVRRLALELRRSYEVKA